MKRFLPTVNVSSIDAYFALPKKQRQKWGLYLSPYALPFDADYLKSKSGERGWRAWSEMIRKQYPIQGFVREWLLSYDNPVYCFFGVTNRKINETKYKIKRLIKPICPRWRASCKRHEYMDVSDIIVSSNFALIQDFWYEEMLKGWVDWNATDHHKEFYNWILSALTWIEVERPILQNRIDNITANDFSLIDEMEQLLRDRDEQILVEMIKHRRMFWT